MMVCVRAGSRHPCLDQMWSLGVPCLLEAAAYPDPLCYWPLKTWPHHETWPVRAGSLRWVTERCIPWPRGAGAKPSQSWAPPQSPGPSVLRSQSWLGVGEAQTRKAWPLRAYCLMVCFHVWWGLGLRGGCWKTGIEEAVRHADRKSDCLGSNASISIRMALIDCCED